MKKIFAILLTLALVLSFAACGSKPAEAPEETTVEETTVAVEETTAAVEETTLPEESETVAEETTADEVKAPETTEEIIAFYNNAVNSAFDAKAGFSKERYCDNEKMDAGVALQAFKSLVYKFMGIGSDNVYTENVTKGNWDSDAKKNYLRKSTLSAADVTSATCTLDGDEYEIVIKVKGGSSQGSKSNKFTNAPIDKCGICVGNEDKGYYDHKTGEVIYDAIDDTYAGATIKESYSNAVIKAEVNAETGKLEELNVDYDIAVDIDIGIGKGTATGKSHISYDDFKY